MSITASEARRRLFPLIEEVNSDRTAVEIVSEHSSAYLVSAAEYEALQETAYLLRSPANARRLIRSYLEALEGRYEHRELLETEESQVSLSESRAARVGGSRSLRQHEELPTVIDASALEHETV